MNVAAEFLDAPGPAGPLRCLVARPAAGAVALPVIVAWSDIFQCTPSHERLVQRLAGEGFVVVSPEHYGRYEPAGTVFDFERDRQRALDAAARMAVAELDADRRAVLDFAKGLPGVKRGAVGAWGFCYGGHLAFRAAFEPEVTATVCCYGTGIHDGKLGTCDGVSSRAGSLERVKELHGELLLVWGRRDPHIPEAGREQIHAALAAAGVRHEVRSFDAEHAFMRDVGPRFDPAATDAAMAAIVAFFRRTL